MKTENSTLANRLFVLILSVCLWNPFPKLFSIYIGPIMLFYGTSVMAGVTGGKTGRRRKRKLQGTFSTSYQGERSSMLEEGKYIFSIQCILISRSVAAEKRNSCSRKICAGVERLSSQCIIESVNML